MVVENSMPGKRGTLQERFETKIVKTDRCWIWTATKNNMGYGMLSVSPAVGKRLAHRISYEMHVGPIPDGLCVLHECDNPACVNPKHLFLGTKRDNVADMDTKGRRVVGINPDNKPPTLRADAHPGAKLTSTLVKRLRERHAEGEALCALARECGINKSAMRSALRGKTWPEAGGPLAARQANKFETYKGEVHANSKLSEQTIKEARQRYSNGEPGYLLAREYGVSGTVMYDALYGRTWKHVT
jgi:hypothetical protein